MSGQNHSVERSAIVRHGPHRPSRPSHPHRDLVRSLLKSVLLLLLWWQGNPREEYCHPCPCSIPRNCDRYSPTVNRTSESTIVAWNCRGASGPPALTLTVGQLWPETTVMAELYLYRPAASRLIHGINRCASTTIHLSLSCLSFSPPSRPGKLYAYTDTADKIPVATQAPPPSEALRLATPHQISP